ncbi:hypothetical protein ANO14919_069140 [Xylariales sp. No.14919]|nr:hypothetical protein ANO14919_069140 [Xylariales sp. No.14919]
MTTQTDREAPRDNTHQWVPLNTWNQLAPRTYNRLVLCFEVDNDKQAAAIQHLKDSALRLGRNQPVLRSLLKVDAPIALIDVLAQHNVQVEVHDVREAFGKTYTHLKETGFPAATFVNPVVDVPAAGIAQALILRIYTVDGGLFLGIHLHHSIGDGKAIDDVISWLSAESRGDWYDKSAILSSPFYGCHYSKEKNTDGNLLDPDYISRRFPERKLLSPPVKTPVDGEWIGKIFIFKIATLNVIQSHLQQFGDLGRPSTSVVLMALLWAYTAKARAAVFEDPDANTAVLTPTQGEQTNGEAVHSKLFTVMDARKRVFNEDQARRYFGNAVEVALAKMPTANLLKSCGIATPIRLDVLAKNLGPIVCSIQDSIEAVDQDSVHERHKMYSCLPDPRNLVLDYFPDDTRAFVFNSWRYIGVNAGQEWDITGAGTVGYPDAIRRAGGKWNWPAAMFLPTRPGSEELEVMITIEEAAMELLLKDEGLMGLVVRVAT